MLALLPGCTRLPWESAEDFFTRCMAANGHQVTDVRIEIEEDGSWLEFSEDPRQSDGRPTHLASDQCWDRVMSAYG